MVINSRDSASRLPGFKFWLHHTQLVSEDTAWPPQVSGSSSITTEQHLPHGVVRVLWVNTRSMLRTVPGRSDAIPSALPAAAQPHSHNGPTNPQTWELQNISILVTQLNGMGPPESMARLNHWQHVLFWSHINYSLGQELCVLQVQKTLSLHYWASHINNEWGGNNSKTNVA